MRTSAGTHATGMAAHREQEPRRRPASTALGLHEGEEIAACVYLGYPADPRSPYPPNPADDAQPAGLVPMKECSASFAGTGRIVLA